MMSERESYHDNLSLIRPAVDLELVHFDLSVVYHHFSVEVDNSDFSTSCYSQIQHRVSPL